MTPSTIAGDFLGLLAEKRLGLFDPAQVGRAPTQTEATTVFAFHYQGGVLMAGDRRATAGNLIVTDRVDKILEVDSTSLLAIAGVPAMAFEMARVLQTSFEYYRRSQLQTLSLPAKVRALARLLRDNLPLTLQGVGVVMPIFAGLDLEHDPARPSIFYYDPLGAQFQAVDFAASGSGSGAVKSILEYRNRFLGPQPAEMPMAEAVRFALHLLMIAAEFDSATGGVQPERNRYATIKLLTSGGVEEISPEDQARFLTP